MDNTERVFKFKASMKHRKSINREVEVKGKSSLHDFAEVIVNAFDFDLDHAFGFFSNLRSAFSDSGESYTLFKDQEGFNDELDKNSKSVKYSYVHQVFTPQKKMLFLFDYGECWEFIVECLSVTDSVAGIEYPRVTKKRGEAPKQYPSEEEYDEDY